jgi:hypothetical protein
MGGACLFASALDTTIPVGNHCALPASGQFAYQLAPMAGPATIPSAALCYPEAQWVDELRSVMSNRMVRRDTMSTVLAEREPVRNSCESGR